MLAMMGSWSSARPKDRTACFRLCRSAGTELELFHDGRPVSGLAGVRGVVVQPLGEFQPFDFGVTTARGTAALAALAKAVIAQRLRLMPSTATRAGRSPAVKSSKSAAPACVA